MEVKRAVSKEESKSNLNQEKDRKLILLNINPSITQEQISTYFSQFGKIEEIRLIIEKKEKKLHEKSFAFVLYKDSLSMNCALELGENHTIAGFQIVVQQAMLRDDLKQKTKQEKKK